MSSFLLKITSLFWIFSLLLATALFWSCHTHNVPGSLHNKEKIAVADSLNHFNPKAADSLYRLVLSDSSSGDNANMINALLGLSLVTSNRGAFDTATILLARATGLAKSINDTILMMKTLLARGSLQIELGDNDNAEKSFLEGITLSLEMHELTLRQKFLLNLGMVQQTRGDYTAALKTFTEGVKEAEKSGDEETLATALEDMAVTLKYTGEIREAISYINRSLEIRKKRKQTREYAKGLQNLGVYYRNLENNDSALVAYRKAYTIFSDLKDSLNLVRVRYNIGIILKNQGKYAEAEAEMIHILQFCREKNIIDGQTFTYSALASVYEQTGRLKQALLTIDSAIRLSQEKHLTDNMTLFLTRRHEILAKLGNYSEAYAVALETGALSDSLLSIDKQREIASLKTRFETERKESENILLKKDLEVQRSKLWILRLGLILGSLLFMIVLAIFYLRQKHLKKQKMMENRLHEQQIGQLEVQSKLKEQELVFQTLVRVDLTHLNRSVREKLSPFKLRLSRKKDQEEFEHILGEITRDASKDPMSEFDLLFRQLHGSFYEKLLRRCPEISKTELQVCALIRLNLSTKDIARLVNITVSTIETTRYHIRKKLELEPGDNLTSFLITL